MKAIVHVQDTINITRIRRTHVNKGLKEQSYDLYISDTKVMGKCYIPIQQTMGIEKRLKDKQNCHPNN